MLQLLAPVCMRMHLVPPGVVDGGVIWTNCLHCLTEKVRLVDSIALYLVFCRRCSGLRSEVCWLLCEVALPCMLGLIS